MRYPSPIFCLMLFLSFHSYAQPGGGGGLSIQNIYTPQLQKIDTEKDTSLNMRFFIMKGGQVYEESYESTFNKFYKGKYLGRLFDRRNSWNEIIDQKEFYRRMYLTYGKDTMIVDLIDMRRPSPIGLDDRMDSIVIQKGYFKYNLNPDKNRQDYFGRRLTLVSKEKSIADGYLKIKDKIDLSFLEDKNMPANFFFNRANFYYRNGKFREALNDLNQGLKINNNQKDSAVLDLIHKVHSVKQ